jgi:hypothetical protein
MCPCPNLFICSKDRFSISSMSLHESALNVTSLIKSCGHWDTTGKRCFRSVRCIFKQVVQPTAIISLILGITYSLSTVDLGSIPTLRRWSSRPHPLKRHPVRPPLIHYTNAPSTAIPTHPSHPSWQRHVCRVDLLGCSLPLIDSALGLGWVDALACRGRLADLQIGAVE